MSGREEGGRRVQDMVGEEGVGKGMRCLCLGREGREDREKKGRVLSGGRGCVLGEMSEVIEW